MSLWNCYDAAVNELSKTTNSVEGWRRAFMEVVGAHHPNIFKFIKALQQEQNVNETKLEQYNAGLSPPHSRLQYRKCAIRIAKIANDFQNRDILTYLKGLAHNFNF